jgi:hypothetical protein
MLRISEKIARKRAPDEIVCRTYEYTAPVSVVQTVSPASSNCFTAAEETNKFMEGLK